MATFDPERFKLAMAQAPQALYDRLRVRMDKYMRAFATNKMARQARTNLGRRTGALARSFNWSSQGENLTSVRWTVFTTSKYARIHEFGGVIRPKAKKALTIPLDANLTKTGRTRASAPSYGYDKTFKAKVDGKTYIFLKTGKRRPAGWAAKRAKDPNYPDPTIKAIFLLADSQEIQPQLGFFDTWEREKPEWINQVAKAVDEALDGLGGGRV